VGGGAGVTVTYSATDSLDALATRINDSVAGVNASVLDVGGGKYRLLVSGEEAGALNSIAFTDSGDGLAFSEMQVAQDASVTIAGTTVTRSSNVFSDVIPGVTLSLKAQTPVGGSGSEVTVARDTTAQKTAVQGVVDAYNSAVRALQGQLTYSGVKKGEDTLFGDPSLQALQRKLGIAVASPSPDGTGTVSARDLGLKLNNDGTITLDAAKFETVAAEDPTKVENLFTGEDGLAARLETVVNEMVTFGTGVFATKETSLRTRIRGFDQEIDKIRDAADSLAERLRRQFTQLETVYSSMQTNLGYFSSMLR
jgi:flagellar hook-associated protein 2